MASTNVVLGPMMPSELSLLTALVAVSRPKNCVEFGFLNGDSAQAILRGLGPEGKLVSYDINPMGSITDPRFTLVKGPMQNAYNSVPIDFIFFDASHVLQDNIDAYERLTFNKDAMLVVHDTGVWKENYFPDLHDLEQDEEGNYVHRPDERKFVLYLQQLGWNRINLGTTVEPRHGLTILQR